MKEKIFDFLQKNYGWIVAAVTGCSVVISFVFKFMKYIYSQLYFDYFGLSYGLFSNEELGIIYDFCLSILLALCFYSLCYCYKQLHELYKLKKKDKTTIIVNSILIVISNLYIIFSSGIKMSVWLLLFNLILLVGIEIGVTFLFDKMIKKEMNTENNSNDFLNYLKALPFYLFLLIILFSSNYLVVLKDNKDYRIIDNNKVIVYTTEDYYLLLNCEVKDKKLKIYKGTQTKVDNINIESKLLNFEEIDIVDN